MKAKWVGWHRWEGSSEWQRRTEGATPQECGVRLAACRPAGGEAAVLPEGTSPEGDGLAPTAGQVRELFQAGQADWRVDLLLVLGEVTLRMLAAQDAEVKARLRRLAEAAPTTWPAVVGWWRRVRDLLGDLAGEGRLPEPFSTG
jgi:hypothetical protein